MTTTTLPQGRRPLDRGWLAAAATALAAVTVLAGTVVAVSELSSPSSAGGATPPPASAPAPVVDDPGTPDETPSATPTPAPTPTPTSAPAEPSPTPSTPAPAPEPPTQEPEAPAEPAMSTAEVQELLRAHGFLVGAADGERGQQTVAAIMAFQRVNGLAVDGVVGPRTIAALEAGSAKPVLVGGPADRIEVDLDRQLLHVVEGGQRVVTLQVSSGNGETYTNASGTAVARTPVGQFVVERRIHGERVAALGVLYDPLYFHNGFAIHGSPSVPPWPASHGCVRVTRADAAWLIERVPDGMPVHVYGGTHVFTP